ncbi:translesion error-prone DNA polymerase V autoproteolytic subunit [Hymenobacter sp. HMF4947]|uniref:Translesion error-prone DNA polymerase V autoproteolytic subunit n=1 Tax=Hymenobacter ginkgonis TaxID=2682976 RepID=A0A7K1TA39_9BACT|nr:translesion error-prone DNA polymerase V autoproteolytic subunit [Hymenobacter ginkgonis]MVN75172.1 translesion error-prone DNA polymerase V autoproteolytic subunit [Hymenobacter ginkgonis]
MYDVLLIPIAASPRPAFLPVFSCLVPAGFPSPANDHIDGLFDLNSLLFRHPDATYLVRVTGESMAGAEIHAGDLLAVDKLMEADHGHIVVAVVKGDCTVKKLERKGETWWLIPANPAYQPYEIQDTEDLHIWGVVTHVVHELIPGKLNALLHSRD